MSNEIKSEEHWTKKGDVNLFMWEKYAGSPTGKKGTVLLDRKSVV